MDMTHRMSWPELICLSGALLGVATSSAVMLAGETTLAFLGAMGSAGLAVVWRELRHGREAAHVPSARSVDLARESGMVDYDIPDYEAHQVLAMTSMCARPGCGERDSPARMDWDDSLGGFVCKPGRCKADATSPEAA
jgi:hypothetical protein